MSAKVMIVVTHLLGTGHLSRAMTLGRSFAAAGCETHVVSGGFPMRQLGQDGVILHQLPALRSDGTDFSNLLTQDGSPASDATYAARARMLLDLLHDLTPNILITELFPFGRRNLKSEFLALLQAVPTSTRVFASVRDILAPPSKPAKATFAEDTIMAHYDAVLVHSDPGILPLTLSWPISDDLRPKLLYTGFVATNEPIAPTQIARGEILVSAGGGNVGDTLFNASLMAATSDTRTWRLLVGGHDAEARIAALRAKAPAHTIIEPTRPDYLPMLHNAAASVSFCGYNTAMDLLQTGVPSVLVPFDDGQEVEQSQRARALSALPGFSMLRQADLTPQTLLQAIHDAEHSGPRGRSTFKMDGARETVRLCLEALQ